MYLHFIKLSRARRNWLKVLQSVVDEKCISQLGETEAELIIQCNIYYKFFIVFDLKLWLHKPTFKYDIKDIFFLNFDENTYLKLPPSPLPPKFHWKFT